MDVYKQKSFSLGRLVSMALRGLTNIISVWPLVLIAVWYFAPTTLHLRWTYEYRDFGSARVYYACTYLGPGGFVNYMHGDTCPFVAVIDRRK